MDFIFTDVNGAITFMDVVFIIVSVASFFYINVFLFTLEVNRKMIPKNLKPTFQNEKDQKELGMKTNIRSDCLLILFVFNYSDAEA